MQALIPTGFMPSFDGDHVGIEICSTFDLSQDSDDTNDHNDDVCPYSVISQNQAQPSVFTTILDAPYAPHNANFSSVLYHSHSASIYPTRAPPAFTV